MTEHQGQDSASSRTEAQVPHSGVHNKERPVREYNDTPLPEAPLHPLGKDPEALLAEVRPEGITDEEWENILENRKLAKKTREAANRGRHPWRWVAGGTAVTALVTGGAILGPKILGGSDATATPQRPTNSAPTTPGQTEPTNGEQSPTPPVDTLPTTVLDRNVAPFTLTEYSEQHSPKDIHNWFETMSSPIAADYLQVLVDNNDGFLASVIENSDQTQVNNVLAPILNPAYDQDMSGPLDDTRARVAFMSEFWGSPVTLPGNTEADIKLIGPMPGSGWTEYNKAKSGNESAETDLVKNAMIPDNAPVIAAELVRRAIMSGEYSPEELDTFVKEMAGYAALSFALPGEFESKTIEIEKDYQKWVTGYANGKPVPVQALTDAELEQYNHTGQIVRAKIVGTAGFNIDTESLDPDVQAAKVLAVITFKDGGSEMVTFLETPAPSGISKMVLFPSGDPSASVIAPAVK